MGSLIALIVAFITILMNDKLFILTPTTKPGPLVSSYIFLLAMFLLLCEIPMYPNSLRNLGRLVQGVFEVIVAAFIAEGMTVDFWLPLEAAAMENVPKLADLIEDMLSSGEWHCETLCNILRDTTTRYVVSYTLSIFFLMAVLHATRIIDLRALDYGLGYFISDISFKFKHSIKKHFVCTYTEIENEIPNDEDIIIKDIINSNIVTGCSVSDNQLTEKQIKPIQKKKRMRRNSIQLLSTVKNGEKSDKSDSDNLDHSKRQTRSSTCCSPSNQFVNNKSSCFRNVVY